MFFKEFVLDFTIPFPFFEIMKALVLVECIISGIYFDDE